MDFWGPILGGSQWKCPKNFREKKLHLQLNNFTQKLDFDVLWFRRRRKRTKFRKKKKETKREKKEINLIAANRGLIGMKGYLIFFAVLKPFSTETAFYAKLAEWFSGSKIKVT